MVDPMQDLSESLQKPEVNNFIIQNRLEKVVNLALKLEGLVSHYSIHAAAVVIAPKDINEFVPLMHDEGSELPITQYDMRGCEDVGLVKYDFLSLSTLDIVHNVAKRIGMHMEDIPLDDPDVFKLFGSGQDLFGVFQFEQQLTQQICEAAKPQSIADLSAINAVIRPGSLHAGFHKDYVKGGKQSQIQAVNDILKETKGILLYQEQLIALAQDMAGLSEEQADDLRKGIGKKKHEVVEHYRKMFIDGSMDNKYTREEAEEVWDWFDKAKDYAFNKSHSMLYSVVSYYCAWMRTYYPVEFFTEFLNAYSHNGDKLKEALRRIKKMGHKFVLPSINQSDIKFSTNGSEIMFGISAVKGIGEVLAEKIVESRASQRFQSVSDFKQRKITGVKTTELLIMAGCFDELVVSRNDGIATLQRKKPVGGLFANFDQEENTTEPETPEERGKMEKELLGIFITKNPLDSMPAFANGQHQIVSDLDTEHIGQKITVCGILSEVTHKTSKGAEKKPYVVCKISDPYEEIQGIVFAKTLPMVTDYLAKENEPFLITGYLNIDTWGDEEEGVEEFTQESIFSKGKMTILDISTLDGEDIVNRKVVMRIPDSCTKEKMTQISDLIKKINNPRGNEVIIDFKGKRMKTDYKIITDQSLEIYLNKKFGIVIGEVV